MAKHECECEWAGFKGQRFKGLIIKDEFKYFEASRYRSTYAFCIGTRIKGHCSLLGPCKRQKILQTKDHHPVPSNFRSILNQKLKFLTLQGKLLKLRQNYMISDASKFFTEEKPLKSLPQKGTQYKQQDMDTKWQDVEDKWTSRIPRDPPKKMRRDAGSSRLKTGLDFTRLRTMTATEAASIAAEAVAEAEAAAVAAEEAAKVAELAEAEWEAAEAAAEAAATFARKCPKKSIRALAMGQEEAAVSG
eukprot:c25587_g1_i1 orf=722-1462(+)